MPRSLQSPAIDRQIVVVDSGQKLVLYAVALSNGTTAADIYDVKNRKEASIVLVPGSEPYVCGDRELASRIEEIRKYKKAN